MKTLNLLALCIFVLATAPALAKTSSNADFDGSGKVDFPDFLQFAQAFGTTEALYDLDNSGTVDFADFLLFVQVFGSEAAPVPAPITTLTEVSRSGYSRRSGQEGHLHVLQPSRQCHCITGRFQFHKMGSRV